MKRKIDNGRDIHSSRKLGGEITVTNERIWLWESMKMRQKNWRYIGRNYERFKLEAVENANGRNGSG